MEESIGSECVPADKPSASAGLRWFIGLACAFIFVATCPFTVGPAVAHISHLVAAAFDTSRAWAQLHPLASWYGVATLSFLLVSGIIFVGEKSSNHSSRVFVASATVVLIIGIGAYLWGFWSTPGFGALYDGIAVAGGVPTVLTAVAAGLVWGVAAGPIILGVIVFLGVVLEVVHRSAH